MKKLIQRPHFLQNLIKLREIDVIKVITGVRRCGKSTLFDLYIEHLLKDGISQDRIIHINLEDADMEPLHNYKVLHNFIVSKLKKDKMNYIFIDEVGRCDEYEKAIDSLYIKENTDIYLTGSNADLLSSEIATLISGRYVEIKMLPFSFAEFYEAREDKDRNRAFADYLNLGSFPVVATQLEGDMELSDRYLEGIYNSIIVKDVITRKGINDVSLLKNIVKYLCSNVGSPISTSNIADYISSIGRKITHKTVDNYVKALVDSYLFYKVERYDIKGKNLLKTLGKYYIVDTGLRNHLLSSTNSDVGHQIENIVYLELLRRNYRISVGKIGSKEIDFVAVKQNTKEYYQVSMSAADEKVTELELGSLNMVRDNYPKYLITLDFITGDDNGIKHVNLIDWLLKCQGSQPDSSR